MWNEYKQASAAPPPAKKKVAQSVTSSDSDSTDEGEDPNTRRGVLGEFRKRYRYNIPTYRQISDAMCGRVVHRGVNNAGKMRGEHEKRTPTMFPLREVATVLNATVKYDVGSFGSSRPGGKRQIDTSGETLKLKKATPHNYSVSAPCFLSYLKCLLYGYVLCSMKDEEDPHRLTGIPLVGVVY